MLLWLEKLLSTYYHGFHVIHYLTLRCILSTLTAFGITILFGPKLIAKLTSLSIGQMVRDDGPKSHLSKAGTPTMGGVLMLIAIVTTTLLWADLSNRFIWVVLIALVGFASIGWVDDYRKIVLKNSKGLRARWKYIWQTVLALAIAFILFFTAKVAAETQLTIPFVKHFAWNLGWLFIPLAYFVIVGSSNAVNLTDGLDGLAILPTVFIAGALGVFAYVTGNTQFSNYLLISYVPGTGELIIFIGGIVGAGLGFLWFNTYPAQVFMGDVGSLALGAALGTLAVIVRQELVLFIMGGIFVLETVSVILQVASFKMTGKRIFRMAPIHHHFELKGWPEPRIIVRFWIITFILVLIGLATLKIR